jgi:hypothetical protein
VYETSKVSSRTIIYRHSIIRVLMFENKKLRKLWHRYDFATGCGVVFAMCENKILNRMLRALFWFLQLTPFIWIHTCFWARLNHIRYNTHKNFNRWIRIAPECYLIWMIRLQRDEIITRLPLVMLAWCWAM